MSGPGGGDPGKPGGAPERAAGPLSRLAGGAAARNLARGLPLALGVAAVALALVDLVHHRHELFAWEGLPGFHAVFGFLAFAFIVLMGWPLRRLLERREDYYGEDD